MSGIWARLTKGPPAQGIFLSYRRQDTTADALLLKQRFERIPGARLFVDLDSIDPGVDFAERIRQAVDSSAVLVALIGPQWVTLAVQEGREEDYVRLEIKTALERGVRVIPVLVNGAKPLQPQQLPSELQSLARLNAFEVSYGRYQYDADQLVDHIQQELARVRRDLADAARKAQEEAKNQDRTAAPTVAEQYATAIDLLGSGKLDVRVGSIYALERIAQDSATHRPAVMEVLAAFIREHSHQQGPVPGSGNAPVPRHTMQPDVQAALTVIGRRDPAQDQQPIDLAGAGLAGADLHHAALRGANLARADLTSATLASATLATADLTTADLTGADLTTANLGRADLTGADLTAADLTGANLAFANLAFADLTDARLTDADLTGANRTGARWPADAPTPQGWQRDGDSGRLQRAAGYSGDAVAE